MNSITTRHASVCVCLLALAAPGWAAEKSLTIKATNKLSFPRLSQTIELTRSDLAALGETNLQKIHVRDALGKEILCQAVDTDYDAYHTPDIVIFQADFAAGETKGFQIVPGDKQHYKLADFKAHGRFVRERFDDFAWENNRIAHRTYGKALEDWAGEPLTSSTIDIWSKRVPGMVIDEWYMVDNYHADTGQGADFYSAGASRGCGGNGLWLSNQLWVSKNFAVSRVLANGPIRVMFELVYEAFDVDGKKVSEVKRVTLDADSQLDHIQSFYRNEGSAVAPMACGVGLKKVGGERLKFDRASGFLTSWQKMEKNAGMQGLAIVADPAHVVENTTDKLNNLLVLKLDSTQSVSYWAGFAWDKAGRIRTEESWNQYVAEFARGMASPIEVKIQ